MKTVRRLLYRDIASSVVFVALAFLSLFFFIDFVDELADVGKDGYTVGHAALLGLYELPGHTYELMPIAVLIGSIYALARLAQSSEFTILRTGGLGPGRALGLLALLGLAFAAATLVVGDYVAPWSERQRVAAKASYKGGLRLGDAGAWLKDRRETADGELNVSVNVGGATSDGALRDVRIFEFDSDGALVERLAARRARVGDDATWLLEDVTRTRWNAGTGVPEERFERFSWPTTLDAGVVAAAVLPLQTMSTLELWRYASHLEHHEQAGQRYEIAFWKRALYPFACLVMVALALPFAYLHARSGGVSWKVFGGIMLGISFVLLNNVAGHLGVLRDWTPWLVASAPSALYLLMSLAAFWWLVRYR
jgi:lipopolysaccharide export system permease protein